MAEWMHECMNVWTNEQPRSSYQSWIGLKKIPIFCTSPLARDIYVFKNKTWSPVFLGVPALMMSIGSWGASLGSMNQIISSLPHHTPHHTILNTLFEKYESRFFLRGQNQIVRFHKFSNGTNGAFSLQKKYEFARISTLGYERKTEVSSTNGHQTLF